MKLYKNSKLLHICFVIMFLFSSALIIYKCRFGFGNIDEAFYLTIPYRLWQGDALFRDEWNLAQMSGFLLYPLVSAFLTFFNTTDGIILRFRYIFVSIHIIVSLSVFLLTKKKSLEAASILSLLYLLYAPYNIMALSYNSMGLGCAVLSFLLLFEAKTKIRLFISGCFYAMSVLCCPYFAVFFLLFLLVVLLKKCRKNSLYNQLEHYEKCFPAWLAGVFFVAVLFFLFVFHRISISEFLNAIPVILNDPHHPVKHFVKTIVTYFTELVLQNGIAKISLLAICIVILISFIDKNKHHRIIAYFAFFGIVVLLQIWNYLRIERYVNHRPVERIVNFMLLPPILFLPFPLFFSEQAQTRKMNKAYISGFVVPGFLYTICMHFASDQGLYIISSASFLLLIGAIMMLFTYIETEALTDAERKIYKSILMIVMVIEIAAMGYLRYNTVYWEPYYASQSSQQYLIDSGPEKGLYVTAYKKEQYDNYYNDVVNLNLFGKGLFFSNKTWLYLVTESKFATYSAWLTEYPDQVTAERLEAYYAMNPENYPEWIYTEEKYSNFAEMLLSGKEYTRTMTENGSYLYLIAQNNKEA